MAAQSDAEHGRAAQNKRERMSVSVCCRNSQLISLGSSTFEIGSTGLGMVEYDWLLGPMLSRVRENHHGVSPFPGLVIPASPAKTSTALSIGLTFLFFLTGFLEAALVPEPTWDRNHRIKIASYFGESRY